MALAGQHPAKRKPLLRGQPHHRAVGPHRGALLLQVSLPTPRCSPSPLIAHVCSASRPSRGASSDKSPAPAWLQHRGQRQPAGGAQAPLPASPLGSLSSTHPPSWPEHPLGATERGGPLLVSSVRHLARPGALSLQMLTGSSHALALVLIPPPTPQVQDTPFYS